MSGEEVIEVEGKITAVLPSTMFRAELENGHQVLAHISGKLRKHFIKITVGDIVKMEMSTQDLEKARIVYRLKNAEVNRNAPIRSFGPRNKISDKLKSFGKSVDKLQADCMLVY